MKYFRKYNIFISSALLVFVVLALKLLIEYFSLEVFGLSSLFTSIIAGGVFILSIMLSNLVADYKESDKLPAEIAAAIENIYDEGLLFKEARNEFHIELLRQKLFEILEGLESDIGDSSMRSRKAHLALDGLHESFEEMAKLGLAPNYIVRLKQEQGLLRKGLLRMYHIQRINFIPSASILAETMTVLIIGLLLFTKIEPWIDGLIMVTFISYLFIYLIKLMKEIEAPFGMSGRSMDNISLFLLREVKEEMSASANHHVFKK